MSELTPQEIEQLLAHAEAKLIFTHNDVWDSDALYHNLALCVVDAVFSINAKYQATQNAVNRFAKYAQIPTLHSEGGAEPPITDLLVLGATLGSERMADEVFQNRQRTSTKNGILKAEAVIRFAAALVAHGVTKRQDLATADIDALTATITSIPGQRSGVSLRYFWMLVGDYNHVKPDRMLMRFVYDAIGRTVSIPVCATAIQTLTLHFQPHHNHLTPRSVDARIWHYQRGQKNE